MKKQFTEYGDKISKKIKALKKEKHYIKNRDIQEESEIIEDDVIEVNTSGNIIKIPMEAIIMIKKKALQTVFYLVSNEKIISNMSFEDWLVLLPGHIFEKSSEDIIFQRSFI
jgi:hypothetical protein